MSIAATFEYGLVIRRAALAERGVDVQDLLKAMEASAPLDQDGSLISFGPAFGDEALAEFTLRLSGLGLRNVDDFVVLAMDHPSWLAFRVQGTGEA